MTATQPTEKYKLLSASLGIVTTVVGVLAIMFDGRFEGAGIVTAGLAVTAHALQ